MSDSLTQLRDQIAVSMSEILDIETLGEKLRITTQCLYPSNGLVRVSARPSGTLVIVSDDGGAFNEAQSAGVIDLHISDRGLRHLVGPYGARIEDHTVFATVPREHVGLTAIFVANASRAVADWLYLHMKIRPKVDFRLLLTDILRTKFDANLHHGVEVAGKRSKHKFANLISLPHGRRILVDPVLPESASLTSRIVAHLDVRETRDPLLEQRLIYDDADRWSPENLNLLAIGAPAVPFSRSKEVLERLSEYA